ncbi:hypothetical protein HPP92_005370 [Vanilla planifolia]|uniref:Uncharacterized protein n=1 Tax=Vanilla planifolia TaxID=51239 RepID=A0A835RUA8_VANPL|nr:hypothetical protein HPP92_005370 [Vanilla planifolia]
MVSRGDDRSRETSGARNGLAENEFPLASWKENGAAMMGMMRQKRLLLLGLPFLYALQVSVGGEGLMLLSVPTANSGGSDAGYFTDEVGLMQLSSSFSGRMQMEEEK